MNNKKFDLEFKIKESGKESSSWALFVTNVNKKKADEFVESIESRIKTWIN